MVDHRYILMGDPKHVEPLQVFLAGMFQKLFHSPVVKSLPSALLFSRVLFTVLGDHVLSSVFRQRYRLFDIGQVLSPLRLNLTPVDAWPKVAGLLPPRAPRDFFAFLAAKTCCFQQDKLPRRASQVSSCRRAEKFLISGIVANAASSRSPTPPLPSPRLSPPLPSQ
jgi:hypothetical protein